MASVKLSVCKAPTAEVRLRATPVAETFCGMVRKLSMTWITPLSNGIEALTTLEFWSKPETNVMLVPLTEASTTCPVVTLVYVGGCKLDEMKEVLVIFAYVPFRTW